MRFLYKNESCYKSANYYKKKREREYVPPKCSAVRRICIKCLKSVIHKNDLRYHTKICVTCANSLPTTALR